MRSYTTTLHSLACSVATSLLAVSFNLGSIAIAQQPQLPEATPLQQKSKSSHISFLNGTWEGSYTCGQGLTKLKLVIEAKSTTDIDAIFLFSEHPKNLGLPSGRFRMQGSLEVFDSPDIPDLVDLKGTTWINRPSGYRTVDLRGDISSSKRKITGNVLTSGCSTFEVVKREQ